MNFSRFYPQLTADCFPICIFGRCRDHGIIGSRPSGGRKSSLTFVCKEAVCPVVFARLVSSFFAVRQRAARHSGPAQGANKDPTNLPARQKPSSALCRGKRGGRQKSPFTRRRAGTKNRSETIPDRRNTETSIIQLLFEFCFQVTQALQSIFMQGLSSPRFSARLFRLAAPGQENFIRFAFSAVCFIALSAFFAADHRQLFVQSG